MASSSAHSSNPLAQVRTPESIAPVCSTHQLDKLLADGLRRGLPAHSLVCQAAGQLAGSLEALACEVRLVVELPLLALCVRELAPQVLHAILNLPQRRLLVRQLCVCLRQLRFGLYLEA